MTIPHDVDWSATAAWIALAISITGTIASPLITTILTNRYRLKIFKMKRQEKHQSDYQKLFHSCISSIGACIAYPDERNLTALGENFHNVYAYVPQENWPLLDSFYLALINHDIATAKKYCTDVIHLLISSQAAKHQENP